jgi:predicted nucleic acid-binding protein
MRVFLDTVGLLATWDKSDQWHQAAAASLLNLRAVRAELLTTSYVLLECGNAAARRSYRAAVTRLKQRLEAEACLITPTDEDWSAAWQAYARGEADAAGIVDQVSFVVMRRLGLTRAFTNDNHFRAAGFETMF